MPTIVDALVQYLGSESVAAPPITSASGDVRRALFGLGVWLGNILVTAEKSPPSKGYEPWLIEQGAQPVLARLLANLLVQHGNRVAAERRRIPNVVKAIRFLAKPGRRSAATFRYITFLMKEWNETSIIEEIFDAAGLHEFQFIRALEAFLEGKSAAGDRVREIAASILPCLPSSRGRPITAVSAAHEFLLEHVRGARSYTWNEIKEDFTDSLTMAARAEFDKRRFNPRPAFRRSKATAKLIRQLEVGGHCRSNCQFPK